MFTKAALLALSFWLPPSRFIRIYWISGAPADLMFTKPYFEILLTRGRLSESQLPKMERFMMAYTASYVIA
jgi:hypothetical protein